jgi:hypothetical protein
VFWRPSLGERRLKAAPHTAAFASRQSAAEQTHREQHRDRLPETKLATEQDQEQQVHELHAEQRKQDLQEHAANIAPRAVDRAGQLQFGVAAYGVP